MKSVVHSVEYARFAFTAFPTNPLQQATRVAATQALAADITSPLHVEI